MKKSWMSWGLFLTSVCLVALSPHGLAQSVPRAPLMPNEAQFVGDARVFRAFRPVVYFAGKGEQERAVAYLEQASSILRKVDGQRFLEPEMEKFREQALDALQDFNLKRVYKLLPEVEDATTRRWSFEGLPQSDHYRVRTPRSKDFEVSARGPRRAFGETSGVLRAQPVGKDDERYWLRWRGGIGMGDLPWRSVQRGFEDLLRLFEESFEGEPPFTIQVGESALRKMQPALGAPDRRLLAHAWASFPNVAQHLLSVSETSDVLVDQKRDGVTEVSMRSRFVLSRIASRYPELARYLKQLDDVLVVQVRLMDARGRTLAAFGFDSARLETKLHAFVRDGALVPSQGGARFQRKGLSTVSSAFASTPKLHCVACALRCATFAADCVTRKRLMVRIWR